MYLDFQRHNIVAQKSISCDTSSLKINFTHVAKQVLRFMHMCAF